MIESINNKRKLVKSFVEEIIYKKDDFGHYIYMNSLSKDKLNNKDLYIREQKEKINNIDGLSEQILINYGCMIYKNGEYQENIKNFFSYFKEVDYLVKNYNKPYKCISEELKILQENSEFLYLKKEKYFPENIIGFLEKGISPINCLNDMIMESETNLLLKEIFFMHNYIERGFDLIITKTIVDKMFSNKNFFINDLNQCKKELEDTKFKINLNRLKEILVHNRNCVLDIIEKYGYQQRSDFIKDLSKTVLVMKAYHDGKIYENNIIHDGLISWLEKTKPQECLNIEGIKDILIKTVVSYREEDKSIVYLPKSLFRIEEKINKIKNFIEAIETLSEENKRLIQIQEHIAQTMVFGIEKLSLDERNGLSIDIEEILSVYKEMKDNSYGITYETKEYYEKKEFHLKRLSEALSYLMNKECV